MSITIKNTSNSAIGGGNLSRGTHNENYVLQLSVKCRNRFGYLIIIRLVSFRHPLGILKTGFLSSSLLPFSGQKLYIGKKIYITLIYSILMSSVTFANFYTHQSS